MATVCLLSDSGPCESPVVRQIYINIVLCLIHIEVYFFYSAGCAY